MKPNTLKKQYGLSLIELMIAIALGIFITAGMIQLFVSSKQSYRVQENLSRVQESGRFAMNFLSTDLRRIGYWGCMSTTTTIDNNLNPAGSTFDNYVTEITATNDSGYNSSDTISVKMLSPSSIFLESIPSSASADLKVTKNTLLAEGDIVLVSDCTDGDLLQITNYNDNSVSFDNVVHNTGGTLVPGNAEKQLRKIYGTDAKVYKLEDLTYTVEKSPTSGHSVLFRTINGTKKELVEDVETMQILYGEDANGDNTADSYVPAGTAGLDLDQVVSIRISILVSTVENGISTTSSNTTLEGYTSPTDNKMRRIFTSTIAIRNRLP